MIVLRELHGNLWWDHGERYRLHGHDLWVEQNGEGWRMLRKADGRSIEFPTSDEAMAYVVLAFERYGDSAA